MCKAVTYFGKSLHTLLCQSDSCKLIITLKLQKALKRLFFVAPQIQPFKRQSHKMVKHTQTIRRQFACELFDCVWPSCDIGAKRVKNSELQITGFQKAFQVPFLFFHCKIVIVGKTHYNNCLRNSPFSLYSYHVKNVSHFNFYFYLLLMTVIWC